MITIATVATANYVHFAKGLVVSARENFVQAKFAIDLINVDAATQEEFAKIHPNCSVFTTSCDKNNERAISSTRKGSLLKKLRDAGNSDILLWVDADSVIRKPCENLVEMLDKDMCVRLKTSTTKVHGTPVRDCYSGVFSFGRSEKAKDMLNFYQKYVEKKIYFGSDQDNLGFVYHKFSDANLGILPNSLLDFKMNSESYIWTLKCEPKEINGRFMREHRKYLDMAI